jgi:hypothetical protein
VEKYKKSIESINRRNDWKNTGKGAQFMGQYRQNEAFEAQAHISGISRYEDGFLYSINLDSVGGIYKKNTNKDDPYESHIVAKDKLEIREIDIKGNKCAASVGSSRIRNLAVFELPSGNLTELTEGETCEDFPSFSKMSNNILFSSSGFARFPNGKMVKGPYAAMTFDLDTNEMKELISMENFDFIRVKDDNEGNIYCIKRPYGDEQKENVMLDVLLFPWRMVKAVFGIFNYLSIIFGGESLRSNKDPQASGNMKMKQKSERELFIDGKVVNAEQMYKMNMQRGEKFPGLIPQSWELMKINKDGKKSLVKKGVLDYTICDDGSIIYSNGQTIIRLNNGEEELVEICRLANCIAEV